MSLQVAISRFHELQRAADAAGWTHEQRCARFRGAGGRPRVFALSQYRKQALLCEALLARHRGVPPDAAPCFTVLATHSYSIHRLSCLQAAELRMCAAANPACTPACYTC
jgi:hypothetical protein